MLSYINRQNVHLYKYKFLSKLALLYNLRWKAQHVLDAEVCAVMLNLLCSFPALKMHQELLSRLMQRCTSLLHRKDVSKYEDALK